MLTSSVLVALSALAGAAAEPARAPAAFQHDHTATERAQRGATQLQVLRAEADKQGEAGAPQASCWAAAVAELESGCAQIAKDDDVQSRLAVQFTNCHLAKSGLPTYECTAAMSLQESSALDGLPVVRKPPMPGVAARRDHPRVYGRDLNLVRPAEHVRDVGEHGRVAQQPLEDLVLANESGQP